MYFRRTLAAAKDDFFTLLKQYAAQHVIILEDGRTVPWIDENLDALTGEWLARKIMIEKDRKSGKGLVQRLQIPDLSR